MKYAFYPGCSYHSAAGYKESVDAVNPLIDVRLEEIPDWNCCGATVYPGVDEFGTLLIGARVFALALKAGFKEVVTGCNACYTTLRKALEKLKAHPSMITAVNKHLRDEGLLFEDGVRIRHLIEIYADDVPDHLWNEKRKIDLGHIKVAGYYGCQLSRPWKDAVHDGILERMIAKTGFTPVDHSARTLCCGASLAVPYADECKPLVKRIVSGVAVQKADVITTLCPLCQLNLDQGQLGLKNKDAVFPVAYFSQLAGLSLGIRPEKLGLNKLLIPVNKELLSSHEK